MLPISFLPPSTLVPSVYAEFQLDIHHAPMFQSVEFQINLDGCDQIAFRRMLIGRVKVQSSTPTDLTQMSKYHQIMPHDQHNPLFLRIGIYMARRSTSVVCAPAWWPNGGLSRGTQSNGLLNPRYPRLQKVRYFRSENFL